ncbi:MAG: DUF2442 domain-containing protein [Magnetococcales bacterium]|nr:DUF2442 domain-containing protein [Magnetococcales bacterium]
MPITVQTVEYLGDYRLHLTFNSGESGIADLTDLVQSTPSAVPLRNQEEFRHVFLDEWPTLAWPCGFDLAPEYAYYLVTGKSPVWHSPPSSKATVKSDKPRAVLIFSDTSQL